MRVFNFGVREIPDNYKIEYREAVKAVILDGNNIFLILTNHGDYKFPGGGLKEKESEFDALVREIQEECGFGVKCIKSCICRTIEQRPDSSDNTKLFYMTSNYYLCEINPNEKYELNMDEYELAQEFTAKWISINDAIASNERLIAENSQNLNPWVNRETEVLKFILQEIEDK